MKKLILFLIPILAFLVSKAQINIVDSSTKPLITISKDERIDLLGKKMIEYNESLATKIHLEKGYRLMLLSTTDRAHAIQIRSKLMQQFPDQNVYMVFQSPYIKLKFGDFLLEEDANKMKKQLKETKIIAGNIYIIPEMVEVKPEKAKPVAIEE